MLIELPSLIYVFAFAVIAELVCIRLKIPSVIGLLFTGMIIGPHFLDLVEEKDISSFAEIGAILLLFSIGVEFSFENLINMGLRPVITGLTKIFLIFFLAQNLLTIMGFDFVTSVVIAMMISVSSTALIMRILQQKNLIHKSESKLLLTILILEDVVAIFFLTIISTLKSGSVALQFDLLNFATNFVFSAALLILVYLILKRILVFVSRPIIAYSSEGSLIFSTIFVALLMSSIAKALNLSPAIGAFLAGSMIVSLPRHEVFKVAIKPFDITFSSIFFISIGMLIDPNVFITEHFNLVGLVILSILIIYLSSFVSIYIFGIPKNGSSALLIASLATVLGEFTLLIAQQANTLTNFDFIGFASALVLITAIISTPLIENNEKTRKLFKFIFNQELIKQVDFFITYINIPISELAKHYDKLLKFDLKSLKHLGTLDSLRIYLMFTYLVVFIIIYRSGIDEKVKSEVMILLFLLILPIILKSLIDFYNNLINNFNQYVCNCMNIYSEIVRNPVAINVIEGLLFLFIAFIIPIVFHIFGISKISLFFYVPLLVISLIFFYRSIKKLTEKNRRR
ncbi:MAG: cation:proton antiporter [Candidatus Micrarchaeota archaeon]|nr:cation:proton antiporter [Candidatus Micrarchaeota archaeon]